MNSFNRCTFFCNNTMFCNMTILHNVTILRNENIVPHYNIEIILLENAIIRLRNIVILRTQYCNIANTILSQ